MIRNPLWTPLELHAPTSLPRAAFSPPVLCCLPWRLLPLAAAGLRLLSPFLSLFTLRLSWPATQSFCGLFDLLFWPFVVVCLVLSGLSSCFVGVLWCCACCQPTEVTKDCRVLPAPSLHTHTRHRDFLPPLAYFLEVGLSLNSFVVLFVLAVLWPCPSGTSV